MIFLAFLSIKWERVEKKEEEGAHKRKRKSGKDLKSRLSIMEY